MKKVFYIIVILFIITSNVFSLTLYISDFNIYSENIDTEISDADNDASALFLKLLSKNDYNGMLNIKKISNVKPLINAQIKSSIEASEICEILQVKYVIYGHIKKTYKYYDAELKLFDNEKKEVRKIFYEKIELDSFDELIFNLSEKCNYYMVNMLGLTEYYEERKREFGGINIQNGTGYWFPINNWWNVITGLVCFETGLNVTPLTPLAKARNFGFYLRYGFYVSYSLGMTKPGYLDSYYHTLIFKIPAEFCFELYKRNIITIGCGPQLQLDILYQELLFDGYRTNTTAAFSLNTSLGYEHWFGKNEIVAIGINNNFNFTFYNEFFIDYRIQLYTTAKIKIKSRKKNNNKIKIHKLKNEDNSSKEDITDVNNKKENEIKTDEIVINDSINNKSEVVNDE